jgi:hypothetical protein
MYMSDKFRKEQYPIPDEEPITSPEPEPEPEPPNKNKDKLDVIL